VKGPITIEGDTVRRGFGFKFLTQQSKFLNKVFDKLIEFEVTRRAVVTSKCLLKLNWHDCNPDFDFERDEVRALLLVDLGLLDNRLDFLPAFV